MRHFSSNISWKEQNRLIAIDIPKLQIEINNSEKNSQIWLWGLCVCGGVGGENLEKEMVLRCVCLYVCVCVWREGRESVESPLKK